MRRASLFQWTCCVLLTAVVLVGGCTGGQPENQRHTIIPKGTPIDVERLTTFSNPKSTVGELVYVPVYSSVYHMTGEQEFLMTVTLSIHNIDLTDSIAITDVSYFNTEGQRIREFVRDHVVLGPLATKQFVIPEADNMGGTGANFLVKWESETATARPVIESLMISTSSQQGLSFVCKGTVIRALHTGEPKEISDKDVSRD